MLRHCFKNQCEQHESSNETKTKTIAPPLKQCINSIELRRSECKHDSKLAWSLTAVRIDKFVRFIDSINAPASVPALLLSCVVILPEVRVGV